ncbi:hypothetical protein ABZ128_27530 [Streptomyces sp. NPDC006326]|uniref:hypothetical protein n=1 Tax=Streptomyces sp. NPDC006326 TaxID=3156752 RepID=UPI0033BF38B2
MFRLVPKLAVPVLVAGGVLLGAVPASAAPQAPAAGTAVTASDHQESLAELWQNYVIYKNLADRAQKAGRVADARVYRAMSDEFRRKYNVLKNCETQLHC